LRFWFWATVGALARRRYMKVDPDNRLVADALEAEWNDKLRLHADAAADYERRSREQVAALDADMRRRILDLAEQLPRIWQHPRVDSRERKRILRLLVDDVTLVKADTITAHVRLSGGATRTLVLKRPISSQAVDTSPNQEVRSDLLCRAEELIDVALAIPDMHASSWIIQKFRGLLQIVQPSDAFLLLNGDSCRVDLLLECGRPFEFLAGPELDRRQSEWQALGRYHEARMHQDAANRVRSEAARLVSSAVYALGYADRL
jgi:hypothetical protein